MEFADQLFVDAVATDETDDDTQWDLLGWKKRDPWLLFFLLPSSQTGLGDGDGDDEHCLFLSGPHLSQALHILFHLTLQTLEGSRAGQLK